MPHLIFELSANISEKDHLSSLFEQCHHVLTENLPAQLSDCKTRSIVYDDYRAGDGSPEKGFIHANLNILPGRTPNTLNQVAEKLMALFHVYFSESMKRLNLQITLEISELTKFYFKSRSA